MDKVKLALDRLEKVKSMFPEKTVFAGHSGGKDSAVILDLTKRVFGDDIVIVHNVKPMLGTSNDAVARLTEMHPATLDYLYSYVCKRHPVIFMHSSVMENFVKHTGLKCQIDGARRSEAGREGKSANIIRNGVSINRAYMDEFEPVGLFGISFSYPILDWTDDDVFDYLIDNKITFSNEYYVNGELGDYNMRKNSRG